MRWKLFATLAETADEGEFDVTVTANELTLRDAFDALLSAQPALESEVLDEDGQLHDHIRLLHEGTDPFHDSDGWDTMVSASDELALFPPVSGG